MKRLDLQGIRGLAILSVLGFHLFPTIFPNGYLGVDQFFVLSGFLMCMLLSKSEKTEQSTTELIKNFYIRRLRRILPLYYLITLLALIFLYFGFPDNAIEPNEKSASKALIFLSNRMKTDEENYFEMLSIAVDIFTHTWSLSVEIQFYFLAPFIFLIPSRTASLIYLSIGSCIYFYHLSPSVAFLSVFARIWQFLLGMLAYILSESQGKSYMLVEDSEEQLELQIEEDMNIEKKLYGKLFELVLQKIQMHSLKSYYPNIRSGMTIFAILITFNQLPFPKEFVRPLITILTAGLIIIPNDENNKFLSNKVLTYIGDISYSLYLIHWPIYAYWKLTKNGSLVNLFDSIMISIILAMIIHNYFEKWYISLSNRNVTILTAALFLSNVMILNYESINNFFTYNVNLSNISRMDGVTSNMTLDDAEKLNYDWSVHDTRNMIFEKCTYQNSKPHGWCRITASQNESRTLRNKYKIMIIGNSWAAGHTRLIYQECGYKAKMMFSGAAYACEPLYPSDQSETCKHNLSDFQKHVEDFKPDYAFHITRHISYGEPFHKNGDFESDTIYNIMLNQTRTLLTNIKKKFFILNAIPKINGGEVGQIVKYFRQNMTFVEIDKKMTSEIKYKNARERYSQLVEDCGGKCELFDYLPKFYRNDTKKWRFFDDRGFSYMTYANHLSFHGFEHIRDIIRGICEKM